MTLGPNALASPTMTFMSRCGSAMGWIRARISGLVRSSHPSASIVLALLFPGCLFPAPPSWDPKPSPPVLEDPTPNTTQVVQLSATGTFTLSISEVSEDEGHALRAIWYKYHGLPNGSYINSFDISAGHLDVEKPISFDVQGVWFGPGVCVPITLLVTHIENDSNDPNHDPSDPSDVATATWLFDVGDNPSIPTKLSACPKG